MKVAICTQWTESNATRSLCVHSLSQFLKSKCKQISCVIKTAPISTDFRNNSCSHHFRNKTITYHSILSPLSMNLRIWYLKVGNYIHFDTHILLKSWGWFWIEPFFGYSTVRSLSINGKANIPPSHQNLISNKNLSLQASIDT